MNIKQARILVNKDTNDMNINELIELIVELYMKLYNNNNNNNNNKKTIDNEVKKC